jgi:hypothetical protein
MKVFKLSEFIREEFQDPPEEYIKTALTKLQKKIESFFEDSENERDNLEVDYAPKKKGDDEVMTMSQAIEKGKENKKSEGKMSFKDLNVHLESSEMSKYSAIYDSLTFKFSDSDNFYSLYITIPLEEGIKNGEDKDKEISDKDIENCVVKFKKYDIDDFSLLGQIGPKKVKIKDIDEEFLVDLKIELDEEFGEEDEEFEIET